MEASNCHSWFGCGFHAVGQGLFSCTLNWLDDVAETWAREKAVRDGKTTTSCVCPCLPLPILPTTAIKHSSPTAVFVHESSHPVIPHIFAILVRFCIKLISGACIIEHTFHLASPQMRAFNSPILLSLWVSALVVPAWYRLWNRNRKRCKRSGPWMCYLI